MMVNPAVALALVLRSRPSTPAIEEARRISLARQATGQVPTTPRPLRRELSETDLQDARNERGNRRPDTRPSAPPSGSRQPTQVLVFPRRSGAVAARADAGTTERTVAEHRRAEVGHAPERSTASRQRLAIARAAETGDPATVRRRQSAVTSTGQRPDVTSRGVTRREVQESTRAATTGTANPSRAEASKISARSLPTSGGAALNVSPALELADVVPLERPASAVLERGRLAPVPEQTSRSTAAITGTIVGAVLLLVAFSSVGLHGKLAKNQIVLDKIRSEISVAERANQRLRVEVAELQAPQRIVAEAERMGMAPSSEVEFLDASMALVATGGAAPTIPPSESTNR